MQLALYAPEEGYYSSDLQKLGKEGDFITAPELTPLFGQTLAKQCQQILLRLESPVLLEFGAGTGKLCVDILRHLEELDCLPASYYILEVSAHLRHRQGALVQEKIPHLASRIKWLDSWPKEALRGVILANEVLDAMPVHRFMRTDKGIFESYVTLNQHRELREIFKPCLNQRLLGYVNQNLSGSALPYLSEVNLLVEDWLMQLYSIVEQGVVLLIDYGFPNAEYYHPDRNQGTLMCHYKHHSHPNPLLHPGEQDLTAHVNFTQIAEAAYQAGFHVAGYTNQASFLIANDLLSLLSSISSEKDLFHAKQAVKKLTHPSEMGELFKVIGLSKKIDFDLHGFQLQDKRASL
jgi:SAM-dependent MidA family methyltransferase